MPSAHFITGVTGYVGSHLALRLLVDGLRVVAMVRAADHQAARTRLLKILESIDGSVRVPVENLYVFAGDVQNSSPKIAASLREVFTDPIDVVWHSAVTFKFRKQDLPEIEAVNVQGSRNVIQTSLILNGEDAPPRYMHVSTAYSSGRLQDIVPESIVESTPDYRGLYEWSKHKVELEVAAFHTRHHLDLTILRPAIIVGSEGTGSVTHSGYYQVIGTIYKFYLMYRRKYGSDFDNAINMRFEAVPHLRLNLVPIDYVVDGMVALSSKEELHNRELKVFNLVNEDAPILRDIVDVVEDSLGIRGLTIVDKSEFKRHPMNALEKVFARAISFQAPYIRENVMFETRRFRELVSETEVPVPVVDRLAMHKMNVAYFREIRPELERTLQNDRTGQLERSLQI